MMQPSEDSNQSPTAKTENSEEPNAKAAIKIESSPQEKLNPSIASSDNEGTLASSTCGTITSTGVKPDATLSATKSSMLYDSQQRASSLIVGSFGPLSSFFWCLGEAGTSWRYLEPRVVSFATLKSWHVNWPYCVALSPHGAAYFAYESRAGGGLVWRFIDIPPKMRLKGRKARRQQFDTLLESYAKLKSWLAEQVVSAEDIKKVRVVFGPGARYMAWNPNGPWIGNDLPATFHQRLEGQIPDVKAALPWHVTFGLGNAWAALWPDGSESVQLDGRYKELEEVLVEFSGKKIAYILLNCCCKQREYIVSFESMEMVEPQMLARPSPRRAVLDEFQKQMRQWSNRTGQNISTLSRGKEGTVRRVFSPDDANKALKEKPATFAERQALEFAETSAETSKKALKVAERTETLALLALCAVCSVM